MYKVLHLDESELIRKMVSDILTGRGFEFIYANTMEDAYGMVEDTKVDLIITSMYFEGKLVDGFVKKIQHSTNQDTPVLVVTGHDIDEKSKFFIDLGVSDYMTKDNIIEELSKHVENILKQDEMMNCLKRVNIAVIDDSIFDLEFIKGILGKNGIKNVDCYTNGADLLKSGKRYTIYLVDAVLKNEFGKQLITKIRINNMDASVIIVSSLTNPKTIVSLMNAGADDFITKPLEESIFIAKLKSSIRYFL